jgi:hypothetical protein
VTEYFHHVEHRAHLLGPTVKSNTATAPPTLSQWVFWAWLAAYCVWGTVFGLNMDFRGDAAQAALLVPALLAGLSALVGTPTHTVMLQWVGFRGAAILTAVFSKIRQWE